jgi:hypothetical protein
MFQHPFAKKIFEGSLEENWTAEAFHAKCDGNGPTLILVRTTEGRIFGGFTDQSFEGGL